MNNLRDGVRLYEGETRADFLDNKRHFSRCCGYVVEHMTEWCNTTLEPSVNTNIKVIFIEHDLNYIDNRLLILS